MLDAHKYGYEAVFPLRVGVSGMIYMRIPLRRCVPLVRGGGVGGPLHELTIALSCISPASGGWRLPESSLLRQTWYFPCARGLAEKAPHKQGEIWVFPLCAGVSGGYWVMHPSSDGVSPVWGLASWRL